MRRLLLGWGPVVFEIGPGEGVLTEKLLEAGYNVVAIEIDKKAIEVLQEDFRDYIASGQLIILEKDCLDVNYDEGLRGGGAATQEYTLVGNIPYYITGAIFRHTFEQKVLPKQAIFLVQKEVAQRVVARDKKESILSVSIKIFTENENDVEIVDIVKAGSFAPPPKVDSAILGISNIINPFAGSALAPLSEGEGLGVRMNKQKVFFQIFKAAFSQKRKFLMSNLKNKLDQNFYEKYLPIFNKIFLEKYGEKIRAEDVDINDWKELIKFL